MYICMMCYIICVMCSTQFNNQIMKNVLMSFVFLSKSNETNQLLLRQVCQLAVAFNLNAIDEVVWRWTLSVQYCSFES